MWQGKYFVQPRTSVLLLAKIHATAIPSIGIARYTCSAGPSSSRSCTTARFVVCHSRVSIYHPAPHFLRNVV